MSGTVSQRHTRDCPRDRDGRLVEHRCRGPWGYTVDAGHHPDGRRRQATRSGFATRREAKEALAEKVSLLRLGVQHDRRLTFGAYLDEWMVAKQNLRVTTLAGYQSHITRYLKPGLGHMPLHELRVEHIDALYAGFLEERPRAAATALIQSLHKTLRSALNTAVRRRLIQWNPATIAELPSHRRKRSEVWDAKQLAHFLEAAQDEFLYPVFHLLAFTGMRRGEVLGLHWEDVFLAERQLRVAWQLVDTRGQPSLGHPKTSAGFRVIPIDSATVDILSQRRAEQDIDRAAWGAAWKREDLVFTTDDGDWIRPERITYTFRRIVIRAGLPPIRLHDLRHTHASLALAAGIDIKVVSDRLGHSTTTITRDLYTHVVPAVARQAADQIAGLIHDQQRESRR